MAKTFSATKDRSTEDRKATDILKEDHGAVKDLFKQYRALEDGEDAEKKRVFDEVDRALTVHSAVEEEIFYPAVKALDTEEPVDQVLEATEEHLIVKTLLGQLETLTPDDESFDPKMKVLMEAVEHHAEEEEKEMFPSAKKGLGDEELRRLGELITERKRELEERSDAAPRKETSARASRSTRAR